MKTVKGCFEIGCISNEKKIKFKKEETYCPYCGKELNYVCKNVKCHTMLPDDSEEYCVRCKAEKEDRKDANIKRLTKAGSIALGVLGTVGSVAFGVIKKGNKK